MNSKKLLVGFLLTGLILVGCGRANVVIPEPEVVVSDASDDGTKEMLVEWAKKEPKLRILHKEWVQPVGDVRWFVKWLNEVRGQLRYPFQMTLDADEVLDERAHPIVREAADGNIPLWFERINYWKNARTVIPHGETCGNLVVRCGPTNLFMPSDEPYPSHEMTPQILKIALKLNKLPIIHHYGFLRKNDGMFAKCKVALVGFFGSNDTRMIEAEKHPERRWNHGMMHTKPYLTYDGPHPAHCIDWLKERGAL